MDALVLNMMKRALKKLAGYTDEREVRKAQFANIKRRAASYAARVNTLKKYLESLQKGEIKMKTNCYYTAVKQGWDAYLAEALANISQFKENKYDPWMAKIQQQETQCAEVGRDLVLVGTLKQMLKLWPAYAISDCVLGTDYRADKEAAYGTPYADTVTDIDDTEKVGDNAPIDKQIWDMVAAIETKFDKLAKAVKALT